MSRRSVMITIVCQRQATVKPIQIGRKWNQTNNQQTGQLITSKNMWLWLEVHQSPWYNYVIQVKECPFWQLSINFDFADIHQILKGRNRLDRTVPSVDLILYEEPPSAVIFLSIIMESPYSAFLYASLPLLRSWTETCPELEWLAETTRG